MHLIIGHSGTRVDLLTAEPYLYLDLGTPGDVSGCGGTRIACRRAKNGWKIRIRPDGGEPGPCFTITDGASICAPKVIDLSPANPV